MRAGRRRVHVGRRVLSHVGTGTHGMRHCYTLREMRRRHAKLAMRDSLRRTLPEIALTLMLVLRRKVLRHRPWTHGSLLARLALEVLRRHRRVLVVVGMTMVNMLLRRRGTEDLSLCLHLLHLLHLLLAGPHSANRLHVGHGDLALSLEPFAFHEVVLGLLLQRKLTFAHPDLALALLLHLDLQLLPLALLPLVSTPLEMRQEPAPREAGHALARRGHR